MVHVAYFCCIVVSFFIETCKCGKTYLIVDNNGPAILESSITFIASLMDYSHEAVLLRYTFNDGINETIVINGTTASYTRSFSSGFYSKGWYNMTVTVTKEIWIEKEPIGSNYTSFQLGESLFGQILVLRNGTSSTNDIQDVGTGENLTLVADVHDPNGFIKGAQIEYMWSIDMVRHGYMNSNHFNYTYLRPGMSTIAVVVHASLSPNSTVLGLFTKELAVKVPVNGINVSGNPFLHHDEVLHLNISCDGTPPFEYCWDILNPNETIDKNFTCTVIVTNTCFFPINRYFQKDGNYQIAFHISNDVKLVKKAMSIVVYSVPPKPQLLTVIIPIVCSVLTVIIIAAGIAYYRQQRRQLIVEVASFDFHDASETYPERTFFEKLWDSFRCRRCFTTATHVESDMFSPEREPLLT